VGIFKRYLSEKGGGIFPGIVVFVVIIFQRREGREYHPASLGSLI